MAAPPEGWLDLAEHPDEFETVEGLLSNGAVAEAEWWGPVPEELWDAHGDGSGWAWNAAGLPNFGARLELMAWRRAGSGSTSVAAEVSPPIREAK